MGVTSAAGVARGSFWLERQRVSAEPIVPRAVLLGEGFGQPQGKNGGAEAIWGARREEDVCVAVSLGSREAAGAVPAGIIHRVPDAP